MRDVWRICLELWLNVHFFIAFEVFFVGLLSCSSSSWILLFLIFIPFYILHRIAKVAKCLLFRFKNDDLIIYASFR